MVQKLEAIKGDGGSIRLGATGTIGTLMTRELECLKSSSEAAVSCRGKPRSVSVSIFCSANTRKRLQARKSLDEAGSSGSSNNSKRQISLKHEKSFRKSTHRVPMLGSDYLSLDRTPIREKPDKRTTNIVEIVDVKCGNPDRAWATPLTSKLKKLGFSKLSESMI